MEEKKKNALVEFFSRRAVQKWVIVILFLIIPIALLVVFTYLPLFDMVGYSFFKWNGTSKQKTWIGLNNYIEVFTRPEYLKVLKTSIYYFIGSIVQIILALFFATILNYKIKGRNFFKGVIFFPSLLNGVAIGLIFLLCPCFGQRDDFEQVTADRRILAEGDVRMVERLHIVKADTPCAVAADQIRRSLFTPLKAGVGKRGTQISQNPVVGIAEQQIVWYRSFKLRHRKGVLRDTLGMELAFPLLTLTAALGLLHIGEQENQHDPKPPEGKYPYQKPRLPGSAYQSHDGDDSTDQDCDAAAQKSFVVTHVVTVLPFKFCLKTKKGTAPSFSSF